MKAVAGRGVLIDGLRSHGGTVGVELVLCGQWMAAAAVGLETLWVLEMAGAMGVGVALQMMAGAWAWRTGSGREAICGWIAP